MARLHTPDNRTTLAFWAGLCLWAVASIPAPSLAQQGGESLTTIAGPWCGQDRKDYRVGSLAVGSTGPLYFEVGPREEGLVFSVDIPSRTIQSFFQAGLPRSANPAASGIGEVRGRLASDGKDGLVYAAGSQLFQRSSSGSVQLVAGKTGGGGRGSDEGNPARAITANLDNLQTLTTDQWGNVFLAEKPDPTGGLLSIKVINRTPRELIFYPGTPSVRSVGPGEISAVASIPSSEGPNVKAAGSRVGQALAISVQDSRLYVATEWGPGPGLTVNHSAVRVLNLSGEPIGAHGKTLGPGELAVVVGGGPYGFAGDGGVPAKARFASPRGLSADDQGNLYIADTGNHRIRKLGATGVLTTIAGTGAPGFNGNDRYAASATLNGPEQVRASGDGIYISDSRNDQIRLVDATGYIRAVSGRRLLDRQRCTVGNLSEEPLSPGPQLHPSVLAVSSSGQIYFADAQGGTIARVEKEKPVRVAGDSARCSRDGCRIFSNPRGSRVPVPLEVVSDMEFGPDDVLYFVEGGRGRVRAINLGNNPQTVNGIELKPATARVIAGLRPGQKPKERGNALGRDIGVPGSIAVDIKGGLYIGDSRNARLLRVDSGGKLSVLHELTDARAGHDCCSVFEDITADSHGSLYVADGARIWYLNLLGVKARANGVLASPRKFARVAGGARAGLGGDGGPALDAGFQRASAVAADENGVLYVADSDEGTVRAVDSNGTIATIAGLGRGGFNGEGLRPQFTALSGISDIALDGCSSLVIAETGRIRRMDGLNDCGRAGREHPQETRTPAALWIGAGILLTLALAGSRRVKRTRSPARKGPQE